MGERRRRRRKRRRRRRTKRWRKRKRRRRRMEEEEEEEEEESVDKVNALLGENAFIVDQSVSVFHQKRTEQVMKLKEAHRVLHPSHEAAKAWYNETGGGAALQL
eukprot:5110237-Pyramimonas_sp.AAC.1